MLRALIFDVDGTLADTERVHLAAFNHAFKVEGLDWHWDVPLYTRLLEISGGQERMLHHWRTLDPHPTRADAEAQAHTIRRLHQVKTAHYEAAVNGGALALRPGVLALLNEAREQGLRLAIATTTSPVNIAALMRPAIGAQWRSYFAAIGDAGNAPIKKPHPQVYLKVLTDLGLRSADCLAFEDSFNGLRAARAAGLDTVITPNGFTAHHDFTGALRILSDLSGVTLARLQAWRQR